MAPNKSERDESNRARDRVRDLATETVATMTDALRQELDAAERMGTFVLGIASNERVVIWHNDDDAVVSLADGTFARLAVEDLNQLSMWASNHQSRVAATEAGVEGVA